ncbi:MAG: hypothetical protein ACI8RD_005167 [Bacillariaceae sp.]|jgi:hypothetical protein
MHAVEILHPSLWSTFYYFLLFSVCEDRKQRITVYPDCFTGSQCVDVVVDNHFTDTREEAVRLLRRINQVYNLFTHVTNNHYLLMDKRFYCEYYLIWGLAVIYNGVTTYLRTEPILYFLLTRSLKNICTRELFSNFVFSIYMILLIDNFQDEWKTRRFTALNGEPIMDDETNENDGRKARSVSFIWPETKNGDNNNQRSSDNTTSKPNNSDSNSSMNVKAVARLSSSYTGSRIVAHRHTSMQETMSLVFAMAHVKVKDRRYGFRIYKRCFVGSQLIDVLMENNCAPSRKDCLGLAQAINQRLQLFGHVKKHHLLKDKVCLHNKFVR